MLSSDPAPQNDDLVLAHHDYGDGPPLLLLHNAYHSHKSWRPQLKAFSDGFRVITVDLPGHGASRGVGGPLQLANMAARVLALMEHLALERALLLGDGLGGLVAQVMAAAYPEQVNGVVLVNAPHQPPAAAQIGWLDTLRARAQLRGLRLPPGVDPLTAWDAGLRRSVPRPLADFLRESLADFPADSPYTQALSQLLRGYDLSAALPDIQCLTLVLVGEHLPQVHGLARATQEAVRGAFYGVVLGAGAVPHWENPTLFTGITREFLSGAADLSA